MVQPRFIALEGPDGGGKSTQIKLYTQALEKAGITSRQTKEAGGTINGAKIREILLADDGKTLSGLAETLLFYADREEHLNVVVRPSLKDNKWVVSDRFTLSTMAFQGAARGLSFDILNSLNTWVVKDTWPDLYFILNVPPAVGRKRNETKPGMDRFEREDSSFHQRLTDFYLQYAAKHPQTTAVIDASQPIEAVHREMISQTNQRFGTNIQPII